jgi:hypothetical protein
VGGGTIVVLLIIIFVGLAQMILNIIYAEPPRCW